MKILIISIKFDMHAVAVAWGLRQLGCEVILWDWADYPCRQTSSLQIDEDVNVGFKFTNSESTYCGPFDVIWNRRRALPTPMENSNSDDLKIIKRESFEYLLNSVVFLGHENTLWVNKVSAAQSADFKATQLHVAKGLGFKIPATLISNDIVDIQQFFNRYNGKIIFKAFLPGGWVKEGQDGCSMVVLRTSVVSAEDIENADAIQACPGIFQPLIEKDYELRVTVIGKQLFAGRIDSQANENSIDWRYDLAANSEVALKKFELSDALSGRCLALCEKLDLVFGCIDLIVDKTGEIIFLEVNEAGQFLWKEAIDRSLPMLDAFCRLLSGRPVIGESASVSLSEFYKSEEFAIFKAAQSKNNVISELFTVEQ